jgi:hypothetical protein
MADQDEVTPGAIPPKVSPFAKPEGAAAPASPGAPRPITVRLKPAVPAAQAAAAAPEAAPAPAVGIPAPAAANPRATARVPVPDSVASAAPAAIRPVTVRLRPVAPVAAPPALTHTPGSTQPISKVDVPVAAVSPLQPQPPPAPGSHPLPEGPKPPSVAQVQAAKSKTSRISLDSAIGVAPVGAEKEGPKTIRLKRPSDLATPSVTPTVQKTAAASVRQTSRIPDSALPSAEAASSDKASVTQKKTLKIKRPGLKEEAVTAEGEGESFPEGVQMTPISPMEFPEKAESSVFTTVAVFAAGAAAVVLLLLTLCLGAHAMGPGASKNAVASISGPELPWAGRIAD